MKEEIKNIKMGTSSTVSNETSKGGGTWIWDLCSTTILVNKVERSLRSKEARVQGVESRFLRR